MKPLRPYQRECIEALYEYMESRDGHPLAVIPTGGGKSLVIATFLREVLEQHPDTRMMVVTHVKELISQNYAELMSEWPTAPAGIYSAGLNRRDTHSPIIFAGIQSIGKKGLNLPKIELLIVDEAHLIPRKSTTLYRKFFADLLTINPYLKIIGLTATPFRLDSGMLHRGADAMFQDIAYEVPITHLIDNGWLVPLISRPAEMQYDTSGVRKAGGEFVGKHLAAALDLEHLTNQAVAEAIQTAEDEQRRSWLFFGTSVAHCEHIAEAIRSCGYTALAISADTEPAKRRRMIEDHKSGAVKALVSCGVLTTGYNNPMVDLVALLRPTQSVGLYIQMVGRGSRLAPAKMNCRILDFGGNIERHGPIDAITINYSHSGDGEGVGKAPTKACPECDDVVPASARECHCGYQFPPPSPKIEARASGQAILSRDEPSVAFKVRSVEYRRHSKPGKPDSMMVVYSNGLQTVREWVCLEHAGYAREKAVKWWQKRAVGEVPAVIDDALDSSNDLRRPSAISVRKNGKYLEVVGYQW